MKINIFKKRDVSEPSRLELMLNIIENSNLDYLKEYVSSQKYINDFSLFKEEDYCFLLEKLFEDKNKNTISMFKKYYDIVVFKYADIEVFKKFVNLYLKNSELFKREEVLNLINCFENKQILFSIYDLFGKLDLEIIKDLILYIKLARPYFVSEEALYSKIQIVVDDLKLAGDNEKFIQSILSEDKKAFGIYDIDDAKLIELDEKLSEINLQVTNLEFKSDKINNDITSKGNNAVNEIAQIITKETQEYQKKYNEVKRLLDSILEESRLLGSSYINKIKSIGDKYLSLLDQKIPMALKEVEKINQKINALSRNERIFNISAMPVSNTFETSYGKVNVNPFLDPSIAVEKRYKLALDAKKDEVYHAKFDDILKLIITGFHPMLVGPSGVGKTYSVRQLSKILNLPLYNIGFVADEHEKITGFIDATGNYQATDFYKAFKYGGLCFFDEIDNSESKALIELNKILERTGYLEYIFPNGERLQANPNFVVIAASNTWGDGANLKYTSREMMDSATLERFIIEPYDRDSKQEANILKGYEDYYKFALVFREQLKNHPNIRSDISTGSLYSIRDFLNSGLYTDEKIFEYIFKKNIDISVLRNIYDNLDEVQDTNLGKVLKKVIKYE